jgi:hypothetical protein
MDRRNWLGRTSSVARKGAITVAGSSLTYSERNLGIIERLPDGIEVSFTSYFESRDSPDLAKEPSSLGLPESVMDDKTVNWSSASLRK